MHTLIRGARGEPVRDIQARLAGLGFRIDPQEHGEFGHSTEQAVREFQQRRRLMVDGQVGDDTWGELVEAGYTLGDRVLYLRYPSFRGDDVRVLQSSLNVLGFDVGREDGIFGERTDRATHDFQRNVGHSADGIVGSTTVEALRRLRPVGPGPGRSTVREAEALRRLSATIEGARIAVDAGHGEGDPGGSGPGGLDEAAANFELAASLVAELRSRGASPFLLRTAATNPPSAERARAANAAGAEILLTLHAGSHDAPNPTGVRTYYYGREGWFSQAGHRLAELIQQELATRVGAPAAVPEPRSFPLLRETRMPAVHVEPCSVQVPADEERLRTSSFRTDVARGLADAVEAFFGRRTSAAIGAVSATGEWDQATLPASGPG